MNPPGGSRNRLLGSPELLPALTFLPTLPGGEHTNQVTRWFAVTATRGPGRACLPPQDPGSGSGRGGESPVDVAAGRRGCAATTLKGGRGEGRPHNPATCLTAAVNSSDVTKPSNAAATRPARSTTKTHGSEGRFHSSTAGTGLMLVWASSG